MNLNKLNPFIQNSLKSRNPKIKVAAESLADQLVSAQEAEEITQPTLHAQSSDKPLDTSEKDPVDNMISHFMTDLSQPEPNSSEFGKVAGSFTTDIEIQKLPKSVQETVLRLVPTANKRTKVVQYGMVVGEMVPKVDHHNFKAAQKNISDKLKKNGKRALADEFQSKVDSKYILILNDRIIDGHHHLAKAKALGISSSLKALDLTPARFQKTSQSLFYALQHNRRKSTS